MSEGMTVGEKLEQIREEGLENALERYYSIYRGRVMDASDTQQQGRVSVKLRSIGFPDAHPQEAYPVSPYAGENFGFYFPPHKDSPVWVTFDMGDTGGGPRVLGSWWPNKDKQKTPRDPTKSHVPAEFVKSDGSAPTARGLKTKKGHGLIFEGDASTAHVELWTGENKEVGTVAEKHHRIRLDDTTGEEEIVVASFGGHQSTWRDKAGEVFVEHRTTAGNRILMDDTNQRILIETSGGNTVLMDDTLQKIETKTAAGHTMLMDDLVKKVSITTTVGQTVELDDNLQKVEARTSTGNQLVLDGVTTSNRLITPTGQSITQNPGATALVDPGNVTVTAGGALAMTGVGLTVTGAGGAPSVQEASGVTNNNFTGLKTDTIQGGYTAVVTGAWSILNAALVTIGATLVQLGSGAQLRLVNEQFFTAYNTHVHTTTIPGAPTGPVLLGQGIPGTHTTIQTTAS